MTKKWSSTASLDGQTKRQASKAARREAAGMAKIAEEYGLYPIGEFFADYSPLSADEIAMTDPETEKLFRNSKPINRK